MNNYKLPGYYLKDYDDENLFKEKLSKYGEELRNFLKELYPIGSRSFLDKMDYDLGADGELKELIHESAILYIFRRLVTTSEYVHRSNGENKAKTQYTLTEHLKDTTRFSALHIKTMVKLLIGCLDTARDDFSDGDKNFVRKQVKEYDWKCFVCGKDMVGPYNTATADHMWPRSMGGLSIKANLRMTCQVCNNKYKRDYINFADFHFEEIAMPTTDYNHYSSSTLPKWYEVAIFAKSNYECSVCGQPAYRVGELSIGRKELTDGWHYLNLTAYCLNHNPESDAT